MPPSTADIISSSSTMFTIGVSIEVIGDQMHCWVMAYTYDQMSILSQNKIENPYILISYSEIHQNTDAIPKSSARMFVMPACRVRKQTEIENPRAHVVQTLNSLCNADFAHRDRRFRQEIKAQLWRMGSKAGAQLIHKEICLPN
jgi:hypothetical protein